MHKQLKNNNLMKQWLNILMNAITLEQQFLVEMHKQSYLIILMEIILMELLIQTYLIPCQYQLYLIWLLVLKYYQQLKLLHNFIKEGNFH